MAIPVRDADPDFVGRAEARGYTGTLLETFPATPDHSSDIAVWLFTRGGQGGGGDMGRGAEGKQGGGEGRGARAAEGEVQGEKSEGAARKRSAAGEPEGRRVKSRDDVS